MFEETTMYRDGILKKFEPKKVTEQELVARQNAARGFVSTKKEALNKKEDTELSKLFDKYNYGM